MTRTNPEQPSMPALRGVLLLVCVIVYVAGMCVLIAQAVQAPLRPLIEVRYGLLAYCGVCIACIAAMTLFARRVPVAHSHGGDAA